MWQRDNVGVAHTSGVFYCCLSPFLMLLMMQQPHFGTGGWLIVFLGFFQGCSTSAASSHHTVCLTRLGVLRQIVCIIASGIYAFEEMEYAHRQGAQIYT